MFCNNNLYFFNFRMFRNNELKRLRKLVEQEVGPDDVLDDEEQNVVQKTTKLTNIRDKIYIPTHNGTTKTITITKGMVYKYYIV